MPRRTTEPGAMQVAMSAIATCLPAGQIFGVDRMTLRGSLAVAYYRLADAAAAGGNK